MKLRAKIILTAARWLLSCALLAGCGGSASSAASSVRASSGAASQLLLSPASDSAEENGASDAVSLCRRPLLDADPISNQFEITRHEHRVRLRPKAEDVASYKGVKSNDNGDAGMVLVVEAAAGKAQDV